MKTLAVALPIKAAYDIAEGLTDTFSLKSKSDKRGKVIIFSLDGGDYERPSFATVAEAELTDCRWRGSRWQYKVKNVKPLVPHFPILMEEKITSVEIPDLLIERYPNSKNIVRWLK